MRSFRVASGENALAQQFDNLRDDARGGAFLHVHQQLGALALPTNPSNGNTLTLTINGSAIVITFVTAIGTTAGNVLIAGTAAATAANLLALLNQPQTTTANGVALSAANQSLVSYLSWSLVGTTITPSSNNNSLSAPLSSFTASTNVSSGSWTAQTMQLYVEPGVVYVNGTRVIFSGGSTPTVTAPVSNPRIDVLTVDSSGTLAWTAGAENASPTAPTYPANKVALCELYNVTAETALYDYDNQQTSQGYIYNDVRPALTLPINLGAVTMDILPDTNGGRNLGSASFKFGTIYANSIAGAGLKFGGTGADGALSITSGTTTLSAANAKYFEKNYTSISITATGTLAFSNPHSAGTFIGLRSQGAVTLTSSSTPMIDASGMGAGGGSGGVNGGAGTSGTAANGILGGDASNGGVGGSAGGSAGTAGAAYTLIAMYMTDSAYLFRRMLNITPGSGGGGGGGGTSTNGTGGAGGNGGGALYIECAGALNFTTASGISVAGKNGSDAVSGCAAGGGGGAGGWCLILYGTLTANSGSVTITGGNGGAGGSSTGTPGNGGGGGGQTGGGGGIGGSGTAGGNTAGNGSNSKSTGAGAGSAGTFNGANKGGAGGGGTAGEVIIAANTFIT
jgi:hypothetical protein